MRMFCLPAFQTERSEVFIYRQSDDEQNIEYDLFISNPQYSAVERESFAVDHRMLCIEFLPKTRGKISGEPERNYSYYDEAQKSRQQFPAEPLQQIAVEPALSLKPLRALLFGQSFDIFINDLQKKSSNCRFGKRSIFYVSCACTLPHFSA